MLVLMEKLDLRRKCLMQQPIVCPVMNELYMKEAVKVLLKFGLSSCLEIYLDLIGLSMCMADIMEVIGLSMCMADIMEVIGLSMCMADFLEVIGLSRCLVVFLEVIGLSRCLVDFMVEIGLCMAILFNVGELYMVVMQFFLDFKILYNMVELYVAMMLVFLDFKNLTNMVFFMEHKGMELWVSHQCRHPGKLLEEVAVEKPNYLWSPTEWCIASGVWRLAVSLWANHERPVTCRWKMVGCNSTPSVRLLHGMEGTISSSASSTVSSSP